MIKSFADADSENIEYRDRELVFAADQPHGPLAGRRGQRLPDLETVLFPAEFVPGGSIRPVRKA